MKTPDLEWKIKGSRISGECGFFNHLQTACNGQIFIVNSPYNTHFFKLSSGVRICKTTITRDSRTAFQLVYELETNTFSAFQLNAFQGKQQKVLIKGFKPGKSEQAEIIDTSKAPLVLSKVKQEIKDEIESASKEIKAPEKLNIY